MAERFVPIPVLGLPDNDAKIAALRLNCLGSLYYFVKIGLRRKRLVEHLHFPFCSSLERDYIKDVYEFPRDHFKSTICSEGLPVWWSLPVSNQDIDGFKSLGYSDEFVKWILRRHDPDTRILLVSENITNAAKLGKRIRWHYESNALFRGLFPEVLPTPQESWTNFSLHTRRLSSTTGGAHGEGTFDFIGVGGALQSRHYPGGVIEDDLVGRKAIESPAIMDGTIDFHRLLVGVFESGDANHESNELVVGNRWSFHDLSSYIRENEPWFVFHSHSALGGCCSEHPADRPIFPEEFSFEKLLRLRERLGNYHFSCQFLNNPASPENADFKPEWLGYYHTEKTADNRDRITHEVKDGIVKKDLLYGHLQICMVSDPNHAGNAAAGRCRHSIVVIGLSETGDYYLLDCWAGHASYDSYIGEIYKIADRWGLRRFGLETVAAQKYLAYHISYRNMIENRSLRIIELNGECEAPDGTMTRKKEWRIRNVLSPIFESGRFWIQKKFQDFIGEYTSFPKGRYCDILDAMAYTPQMLKSPRSSEVFRKMLVANRQQARHIGQPYSYVGMVN
jgi:hypothetical protein